MKPPLCLNCGKQLRKTGKHLIEYYEKAGAPLDSAYGSYGDGHFCGLNCGYRWACMFLERDPEYAARLHASMVVVMDPVGSALRKRKT